MTDWDRRYLDLAEHVGGWSKDPSTKTGCVIVRSDRTVVSFGYNGFPRGVRDLEARLGDRQVKYAMVVHAEANAILSAHERLDGCTTYTHLAPCSSCAGLLIQAGIVRVVAPHPTPDQLTRWSESFGVARTMFDEAGVALDLI